MPSTTLGHPAAATGKSFSSPPAQSVRLPKRRPAATAAAERAADSRVSALSQVAGVLGSQWGDEGKGKLVDSPPVSTSLRVARSDDMTASCFVSKFGPAVAVRFSSHQKYFRLIISWKIAASFH
jgi:hypothetical protein